jgi:hypothetical protein
MLANLRPIGGKLRMPRENPALLQECNLAIAGRLVYSDRRSARGKGSAARDRS